MITVAAWMAWTHLPRHVQECLPGCNWCGELIQRIGRPAYDAIACTLALCMGGTDARAAERALDALRDFANQGSVAAFRNVMGTAAYQQCAACQGSLACFAFEVNSQLICQH